MKIDERQSGGRRLQKARGEGKRKFRHLEGLEALWALRWAKK